MAAIPSLRDLAFSPFCCLPSSPFRHLMFTPCCRFMFAPHRRFAFACLHHCCRFVLLFQELLMCSLQLRELVGHGFIGGHRILVSGHCVESGVVDQNDQCGKCHIIRRARIQKGNLRGSFLKGRHCYDPDILWCRIGPEVPRESVSPIALRGPRPSIPASCCGQCRCLYPSPSAS